MRYPLFLTLAAASNLETFHTHQNLRMYPNMTQGVNFYSTFNFLPSSLNMRHCLPLCRINKCILHRSAHLSINPLPLPSTSSQNRKFVVPFVPIQYFAPSLSGNDFGPVRCSIQYTLLSTFSRPAVPQLPLPPLPSYLLSSRLLTVQSHASVPPSGHCITVPENPPPLPTTLCHLSLSYTLLD